MNFFHSCDDRMSRRETRVGFYANIEVWTLAVERVSVVIMLNWTVLCGCGRRMGGKNDSTASNEIVCREKNG